MMNLLLYIYSHGVNWTFVHMGNLAPAHLHARIQTARKEFDKSGLYFRVKSRRSTV